jgi:hypothetical protein
MKTSETDAVHIESSHYPPLLLHDSDNPILTGQNCL